MSMSTLNRRQWIECLSKHDFHSVVFQLDEIFTDHFGPIASIPLPDNQADIIS